MWAGHGRNLGRGRKRERVMAVRVKSARRALKCSLNLALHSSRGVGPKQNACERTRHSVLGCVSISLGYCRWTRGKRTTLSSDDAPISQGVVQKLEVWLLEQALGRAIWVGRVGDDDVEGVLVVVEELEAVADVHLHLGVLVPLRHAGEVLLGQTDDGLDVSAR